MTPSDDEKVRALLSRAGDQPGPPLGFTPTTIARRGRRIRLLRWGGGVAGLVVVFAGVALSLLLVSGRPVEPASPPPAPPAASPTVTTTVDGPTLTTTTSHNAPTTTDTTTTTSGTGDPIST